MVITNEVYSHQNLFSIKLIMRSVHLPGTVPILLEVPCAV